MSYYRSTPNDEPDRSRDPRHRDRSRSEIRRPNNADTCPTPVTTNQPARQEQPIPANGVLEFFKTLGLNSQLIQALINANPPKVEQSQPPPPPQEQSVNNAQFASFLSKSYGLSSTVIPPPNQPANRDPRRRQTSTVTPPTVANDTSSKSDRPTDPRSMIHSNSMSTSNTLFNVSNNSTASLSIDESYKQFLSSIDQSSFDDETRQRFQRIVLLDNELDKLHRMNIELTKNTERRSRRRTSTKDKDPLLKENENLQNELIDYIKTLKTTLMNHYSTYLFTRHMFITT